MDLVNSVPVLSAIANAAKGAWRKASSVMEDIHTWFKYKAGKYVWNGVKIVVAVEGVANIGAIKSPETGKVTGLLDKTVKAGENLYLQFAP